MFQTPDTNSIIPVNRKALFEELNEISGKLPEESRGYIENLVSKLNNSMDPINQMPSMRDMMDNLEKKLKMNPYAYEAGYQQSSYSEKQAEFINTLSLELTKTRHELSYALVRLGDLEKKFETLDSAFKFNTSFNWSD